MNPEILARFADSQRFFTCPVCGRPLALQGASLACRRKHCFDLSKYGYVNLAPKARQSKTYDRQSFENRQTILEHGFYDHILDALADLLEHTPKAKTLLDAGCGEGFYSRRLEKRTGREFLAFDLSRDSIQLAAKSDESHRVKWFVGDLTRLPLKDHSIDCVLDLFTPANYGEFRRLLTPGGCLVKVIPGDNHLAEFRERALPLLARREYHSEPVAGYLEQHFRVVKRRAVSASLPITPGERDILAAMTPLLFHVDKSKIDWSGLDTVTVAAEILVAK